MGVFQRYSNSKNIGDLAAAEFEKLCKDIGCVVEKSSPIEDMRDHIDYHISKNGKTISVEFKGPKRVARFDQEVSIDRIPIEWTNVGGRDGWVKGKAQIIVFDLGSRYLWVNRERLQALVTKVDWTTSEHPPSGSGSNRKNYISYTRKGRKDQICYVPVKDIEELSQSHQQDKHENK